MRRHMMDGMKEKMKEGGKSTMPEPHHSGEAVGPESSPSKPAAMKKTQGDSTRPDMGKAMKHLKRQAMDGIYVHKK